MISMYREYLTDRTKGYMVMPDGKELPTLEPPWLDNEVGVSCIPEGMYRVRRDTTGRFQYYEVMDVPNRTEIEMHRGTKPSHSQGCILFLTDADLGVLLGWFGDNDWVLEIEEEV